MAKSKYDPNTFPLLAEKYARQGLSDVQISNNLGVHKDTFYRYQKKYPDFYDAIKKGKRPANFEVENAMFKAAKGYSYIEYTEEVEVQRQVVDGIETELIIPKRRKSITKEVQPNITAAIFWLVNREPERWRNILNIEHSGSVDTIASFVSAAKKRLEELNE